MGKLHNWKCDFLKVRIFSVTLLEIISAIGLQTASFNTPNSVSQGSILGPLMYIIYVNNTADLFSFAMIKIYADNLKIYATINTDEDKVLKIN